MTSRDPFASQKPIASMPSLAYTSAERKPTGGVTVLQRIRTSNPRSSRIPDVVFRTVIALTAISVFVIVVLIVYELLDKS